MLSYLTNKNEAKTMVDYQYNLQFKSKMKL